MALQHLRSNTASKRPTAGAMSDGQIAVNTNATSPGLFFKDAGGAIIKVGPVHVGTTAPNSSPAGSTGNSLGEQWLDTSGGGYVLKIWDGSAWRSEVGEFVDAAGDTMTGALILPNGTAAAPALGVGSTDNGIYSPGTDQVAISTNGTGRLFVDSNGKVSARRARSNTSGQVGFEIAPSDSAVAYGFRQDQANNSFFLDRVDNASTLLSVTAAGLVGIGTSSPDGTLHVQGTNSGGTLEALVLKNNAAATNTETAIRFVNTTSSFNHASIVATRSGSGTLDFYTADSANAAMRIDSSGNVGIGTTSPLGILQTSINSTDGVGLYLENRADAGSSDAIGLDFLLRRAGGGQFGGTRIRGVKENAWTGTPSTINSALTFSTFKSEVASEKMRIDSSGRLLVGTSTSTNNIRLEQKLSLVTTGSGGSTFGGASLTSYTGTDVSNCPLLDFQRSRGTTDGSLTKVESGDQLGAVVFRGADGAAFLDGAVISARIDGATSANDLPTRLVFSVTADGSASPSEAMRINNAGELLVGYTSDNGAYKLQVNSQIFATSAIIATSDGRYKENVAALDGCVDLVKALRPVSFDWKAQEPVTRVDEDGETVVVREAHNFPDGKQVGFIAQEVEEVLADKPWLGSVIKQNVRPAVTDADGNELAPEEEFLGIAEGNLVAVLTSALKDAIARIESLEAEVAALKA